MKDAKLLWKLQGQPETIKRTFKGVLVVHPDWEKPNWADRSYYRASGINFVAPIARFYDLRKEVRNFILAYPRHVDETISMARKINVCPWRAARMAVGASTVVVCDYNHLFIDGVREASLPSMGLTLEPGTAKHG